MRKIEKIPVHDKVYINPEYKKVVKNLNTCGLCGHSSAECIITGICEKTVDVSEMDIIGVTDGELRDPFHPYRSDGGKVLVVTPCP
ncbi:MAG: hypothetical protein WCV80_04080 [Candidatus Paceibacterota bacterium]